MAATAGDLAAQSGRLSLAERVARLEQQQANPAPPPASGNIELLNRIQDLQTELQTLRNLVEQQNYEIQTLKDRQRTQYIDLDSRIERLRGGDAGDAEQELDLTGASGGDSAAAQRMPPVIPPSPPSPDQLLMEDAPAIDPYTGQPLVPATGAGDLADSTVAPIADLYAPAGDDSLYTPGMDADSQYQAAFAALREGRYSDSSRQFSQFVRSHPQHELADNALYWLGESHYVTQNYETALETFQDLIQRYPDGDKIADAELKIGYCLYELGQRNDARLALESVIQRYPESTVSRLAQSRLRALALDQP
ncbi:MAG: tol-pal system protein YbgF [Xanthomonadales bacterium]|nr:tol-pal system protein YbgF [Xanthomonadales bacterium]